jgi:hypothetical protein
MANNITGGRPNLVIAKQAISFVTAGINSSNTAIIYKVTEVFQSYVPGRGINAITAFEIDGRYYLVALTSFDLESIVAPPYPAGAGGSIVEFDPLYAP